MESGTCADKEGRETYFSLWLGKVQDNRSLIDKTRELLEESDHLRSRLDELKAQAKAKKRARRTAKEILRQFPCTRCGRSYG